MPKTTRPPSLRLHKPSGRAVVTLNGRDVYLGLWESAESKSAYNRVISEWYAAGKTLSVAGDDVTVVELIARFLEHADTYYRRADGTSTGEAETMAVALRPMKELYGRTPASTFGPRALKAVREAMIQKGWCRTTINKNIQRVRALIRWAVANELVPASAYHALQAVPGLKAGRTEAPEPDPVRPVAWETVEAVKPHIAAEVWAMIELQWLTGMRPGEVVMMQACNIEMPQAPTIDLKRKLWVYRPIMHKNAYRGHDREVTLGPRAQEIIRQFLTTNPQAFLFSPAAAETRRNEERRALRRTPMTPSALRRRMRQRSGNNAGDHYTVASYRRAIARACDAAFPVPEGMTDAAEIRKFRASNQWHPHQLRHSAATRIRKEHGLEAAQVILGQRTITATQIYAEKHVALAQKIMEKVG
jgi:integrase